jgi:apolipoprotein D and lipocalin family protein
MQKLLTLIFLFCCSLPAIAHDDSPEALTTIDALDVPRYMGKWYEIARYPNWFQKKCVSDSVAEYSLRPDGKVQVINRCRLGNGEMKEATGIVRQVGGSNSAKLQVSFVFPWLRFIPAVWGDYWVIDLDSHYQLVAVSEPSHNYLWILARTPSVDQKIYEAMLSRLKSKGFDTGKLIVGTHN